MKEEFIYISLCAVVMVLYFGTLLSFPDTNPNIQQPSTAGLSQQAYWVVGGIAVVVAIIVGIFLYHKPATKVAVSKDQKYVLTSRDSGYSDDDIKLALGKAGWSQEQIDDLFTSLA